MIVKMIILLFVLIIIYSLGSALYHLVREKNNSDRMVKALTWRISISILLFVVLFICYNLGWISPHAV